jgi:hypothetical protein
MSCSFSIFFFIISLIESVLIGKGFLFDDSFPLPLVLSGWLQYLLKDADFLQHRYDAENFFLTNELVVDSFMDRSQSIKEVFTGLAKQLLRSDTRVPNVFVLAPPGSGKTTFVKTVARFDANMVAHGFENCPLELQRFQPWMAKRNVLPFFVTFNDQTKVLTEFPEDSGQTAIVARLLYPCVFRSLFFD